MIPSLIWDHCIKALNIAFDSIIELIMNSPEKKEYEFFEELAIENLKTGSRLEIVNVIKDNPMVEAYLHILINMKKTTDIKLAQKLNKDVSIVRREMYPLLGKVILYHYNDDDESTKIFIIKEVIPVVKEILTPNED